MSDGTMVNDFRAAAEAGSVAMLERDNNITSSVCIRVLGSQSWRWAFELIFVFISATCLLNSFLLLPLKLLGVLPESWFWPMLTTGIVIILFMRLVKSFIVKIYLNMRPENLLKKFSGLKSRAIVIENNLTVKKVKIVTEDEGFCIFYPEKRQLLIEGVVFRYAIFAKDVFTVEPVSGYAMGGARVKCRVGGEDLDMVFNVGGQGPLTSLIETFNPHKNASGLSTQINETLFGVSRDTVKRPPPPPQQH